ncbi:lytic transglycosylase domain-containing protein [Caballeronia ptereochthonis]|nr:lytic transglycosylase domain-containing protein [Caballeronia ptereochthonis]
MQLNRFIAERRTRRSILTLLACGYVLFGLPMSASAMLRCEADDDSISYVTSRISGQKCVRVNLRWNRTSPPGAAELSRSDDAAASATSSARSRPAAPVRREVRTQIYAYVENGIRHFSSRRPVGLDAGISVIALHYIETCNFCVPDEQIDVGSLALDMRAYRQEIETAASASGVDSALVRAVIQAESAYRANAISRAGAQGLMQLMPATALRFGVSDPFDAAQNIRGGVRYLSWLLRRFGGDLDLALAGYNSGEAAVDRYSGIPPYDETRTYVSRVKALAERYRRGQ